MRTTQSVVLIFLFSSAGLLELGAPNFTHHNDLSTLVRNNKNKYFFLCTAHTKCERRDFYMAEENKNTKWQNFDSKKSKKDDEIKDKVFVPDTRERRDGPGGN